MHFSANLLAVFFLKKMGPVEMPWIKVCDAIAVARCKDGFARREQASQMFCSAVPRFAYDVPASASPDFVLFYAFRTPPRLSRHSRPAASSVRPVHPTRLALNSLLPSVFGVERALTCT